MKIEITLDETAGTGYAWESDPASSSENYRREMEKEDLHGFRVGGSTPHTFVFDDAPDVINFHLRRSFEPNKQPVETVTVTVVSHLHASNL